MKKMICSLFVAASTFAFASASHAVGVDVSTNDAYNAVNDSPPVGQCLGSEGLVRACVNTKGASINYIPLYTDCVYTGTNRCSNITISAPVPSYNDAVTLQCFGSDCGP